MAIPATALACVVPIRKIGPVNIKRADLRKPVEQKIANGRAWKLHPSFVSVRPRVSQYVALRGGGRAHGQTFKRQRKISIDAYAPHDRGWLYVDDMRPDTPPCQLLGRTKWREPSIFVRETKTHIYIAAASRPIPGDHTGCVLGPESQRSCPVMKRRIVPLKRIVGNRTIVLQYWGKHADLETTDDEDLFVR